jgi:cyclophilin family peptidyl-prolyl cis-trans isomerase
MTKKLQFILLAAMLVLGSATSAMAETTRLLMKTSMGNIELELYGDKAPKTVENFLRYVDEGFYNGTIFHRVINSFMIQGGGFTADMQQKRGHAPIRNEASNGLKNRRGTIAMARTNEPHSASSQFFINHVDNDGLDYPGQDGWGYCVFGKVTNGMKTVDKIADVFTKSSHGMQNVPIKTITINSISRINPSK